MDGLRRGLRQQGGHLIAAHAFHLVQLGARVVHQPLGHLFARFGHHHDRVAGDEIAAHGGHAYREKAPVAAQCSSGARIHHHPPAYGLSVKQPQLERPQPQVAGGEPGADGFARPRTR